MKISLSVSPRVKQALVVGLAVFAGICSDKLNWETTTKITNGIRTAIMASIRKGADNPADNPDVCIPHEKVSNNLRSGQYKLVNGLVELDQMCLKIKDPNDDRIIYCTTSDSLSVVNKPEITKTTCTLLKDTSFDKWIRYTTEEKSAAPEHRRCFISPVICGDRLK